MILLYEDRMELTPSSTRQDIYPQIHNFCVYNMRLLIVTFYFTKTFIIIFFIKCLVLKKKKNQTDGLLNNQPNGFI